MLFFYLYSYWKHYDTCTLQVLFFKCRGHLTTTLFRDVNNILVRCVGNDNNDTDLLTPSASS